MNIAEKYIDGLKRKYYSFNDDFINKKYELFEMSVAKVSEFDINELLKVYPNTPRSMIDLLNIVDGTYYKKYDIGTVLHPILGSALIEFPYYLLSAKEIVDAKSRLMDYWGDYINGEYNDTTEIDEKLTDSSDNMNWLHFADCINNGGSSQLFIDFSPSKKGTYGQVIMFLHDPDSFTVIANSFDTYLQKIMDGNYDFVTNEDFD